MYSLQFMIKVKNKATPKKATLLDLLKNDLERKSTTKFGIKVKVLKCYVSQPENNVKDSNSEFNSEL